MFLSESLTNSVDFFVGPFLCMPESTITPSRDYEFGYWFNTGRKAENLISLHTIKCTQMGGANKNSRYGGS
jgi:hypothetical protein